VAEAETGRGHVAAPTCENNQAAGWQGSAAGSRFLLRTRPLPILELYKRNQGKRIRTITFISVVGIAAIGAYKLSNDVLNSYRYTSSPFVQFGIPVLLMAGVALLMFWIVNRPKSADFLIATEGEMKKVSWSSRKEVIGSTKVVIVTTLIMAVVLFGVDSAFSWLFQALGIRL
jgi:preprotein translocase subunit SecE